MGKVIKAAEHQRQMIVCRRRMLRLAAFAALPLGTAMGQGYPSKPIRLVIGFPPGGAERHAGPPDRAWLSEKLGQPVNVENKAGAAGNIATAEVVHAPADGHTLLLVGPANAISGAYHKLDFNFLRDIVPVAGVTREPLVMVVHPSLPAKTVAEFLAYAKANAGRIKMASTGSGSSPMSPGSYSSR